MREEFEGGCRMDGRLVVRFDYSASQFQGPK